MAVITTNAPSSSRSLSLEVTIASQSIANNTTTLNWKLYGSGGTTTSWVTSGNFKAVINGTQVYFSATRINLYNGTVIASGQHTVSHNADGTKWIDFSCEAGIYAIAVNAWASGGMQLTNIPRQADLTGADNFNDEQNPSITYNNSAGASVTELVASIYNTGGNVGYAGYRAVNKTGTLSYTFNLTTAERDALRNAMPNSNSMTVRFYLRTTIGGNTFYSTLDRTCTLVNGNPTFNDFIYKDTNATTVGVTGNNQVMIKGQSNLQVTVPSANKMVANKGATAKTYNATIDNRNVSADYSASDVTLNLTTIVSTGTKQLSVRAYDSRNNSTVVNKNIIVYDYDPPIINASVERLNNFEAQTTLKVNGSYSPLNIGGVDKNTIATTGVQYRYRETGGTWGAWTNLTRTLNTSNSTFTCTDVVLTLDNSKSFEFEIRCIDNLITTTINKQVSVGVPVFFVSSNKKAIGINCMPPNDALAGSIWYNNKQVLDYDVVDTW